MKRVGSFVSKTIHSMNASRAIELHQLKSAWMDAVGPFVGTQTEPVKVRGDTLFLVVSSPVWAQEIKLQQRLILDKLRKALPKHHLKKLTCWVGEPHAAPARKRSTEEIPAEESVPWKDFPLPRERKEKIEATVATIEDEGLREKMRRLLELSVKRELYLVEEGQLPCPHCGKFRPPSQDLCDSCRRETQERLERRVMRLLSQKPWLSAKDVAEQTPLQDRTTFMAIRKKLLGNLMLSAWQRTSGLKGQELCESMDQPLRDLLLDITMLRCNLAAHLLKPKHFYFALGRRLAEGYLNEDE